MGRRRAAQAAQRAPVAGAGAGLQGAVLDAGDRRPTRRTAWPGSVVHLIVLVLLFVYARRRVGDRARARGVTVRARGLRPGVAGHPVAVPDGLPGVAGGRASACCCASTAATGRGEDRGVGAAGGRARRRRRWASRSSSPWPWRCWGGPTAARAGGSSPRPAVLYGVWYLAYGGGGKEEHRQPAGRRRATWPTRPRRGGRLAVRAGASSGGGRWRLATGRGCSCGGSTAAHADPWRLWALIALPLVFWGLTGLARADLHEPGRAALPLSRRALPDPDRGRGGARGR